ncbi:hypothetical protein [Bradyrhizobium quebecense]|uniref:Uncharacterized protein n=2 Tax=Bradyrhizobium quebecense TaxID=2748629 RepID=A0ABS3MCP8_9BRAD|nr:hypothetical protein [Bradyrhizobium quebecense]UGY04524.1 hypothetical protein J4P68_0007155 [Bradyrhizobium quebecense]
MDEFARRLVSQAVKGEGWKAFQELFRNDLSKPEVYADRIKREFGLRDYPQARALYDSNPAYWEDIYGSDPLNSRNHHASPPRSLLPREATARDPGYDYLGPSPSHSGVFGRFGTGGQFSAGSAISSRPLYEMQLFVEPPDDPPPESIRETPVRRLVWVSPTDESQADFDGGAPAVPFVPSASIPQAGQPATFDQRFGTFAGAPPASTRPLSPFSGQPMRYLPPSVFSLPDASSAANGNLTDWLADLIRARPLQ